jgi:hypothetical protein
MAWMRKSVLRAMRIPDLSSGAFSTLITSALSSKRYPPDVIKDIQKYALGKLEEQRHAALIALPDITEE